MARVVALQQNQLSFSPLASSLSDFSGTRLQTQLQGSSMVNCFLGVISFCLLWSARVKCHEPEVHREFRKPLIVMSPKKLLCSKACRSNLSEFDDVQGHPGFDKQGTRFKRLIKDQNLHSDVEEGIRRLVLCSGKIYYELDDQRTKADAKDVAICRVEQLCPFPYDLVQRELKRYPSDYQHEAEDVDDEA